MRKKYREPRPNRNAVFSGLLYTAKKTVITEKELNLGAAKKQNIGRRVGQKALGFFARLRKQKSAHPYKRSDIISVKKMRRQGFSGFSIKGEEGFYLRMSGAAAAIVVASMLLTSGIFEPATANITVNDAGRVVAAATTEETVGGFLEKNGIALNQGDVLEVGKEQQILDGMEIVIKRALPVTILKGDKEFSVRMLAGTVEEALSAAGISLGEKDEVYPTLDTFITSGITIDPDQA